MISEGFRAIKDAALDRAIAEGKVIRDAERGAGGQPVIRRADPAARERDDDDVTSLPRISELYPDLPPAWNISQRLVDCYELHKVNGERQHVAMVTDLRGRILHLSKEFESAESAVRSGLPLSRHEVLIGPAELSGLCHGMMAPAPTMEPGQAGVIARVHAPARQLRDALTAFVGIVKPPADSPGPAERRTNARALAELLSALRGEQ